MEYFWLPSWEGPLFVGDYFLLFGISLFLEYGVSTFVHHNPFGRIRCINCNDFRQILKCYLWNGVGATNSHFVTMQQWKRNKKTLLIDGHDLLVWIFEIFPLISIKLLIVLLQMLHLTFVFKVKAHYGWLHNYVTIWLLVIE